MNRVISDESAPVPSDEFFEILGNETRVEILLTLWDAYQPPEQGASLAFSDLYDRVDFDGTGNFTYHLDRLTGSFVRRTEAGYALTGAGIQTAMAIVTGQLVDRASVPFTEIDATCPVCHNTLVMGYEEQVLIGECTTCPGIWQPDVGQGFVFQCWFPPNGLSDRGSTETFHRAVRYDLHRLRMFLRGLCPRCASDVEISMVRCRSHLASEAESCPHCRRHHACEIVAVCSCCKEFTHGPIGVAALSFPDGRARLLESASIPPFASWETVHLGLAADTWTTQRDPLHLGLTYELGDRRIDVIIDRHLEIEAIDSGSI